LSDAQDDTEKKEDSTAESSQNSAAESSTQKEQQEKPETAKPAPPRPTIGTPINRPRIGTPIGTPVAKPAAPVASIPASSTPTSQPAPKTPVVGSTATRPTIGTPVGTQPSVGTPVGARPATTVGAPVGPVSRPAVSSPIAGRPTTPVKKPESREDISRRNFMRGLVALGGIVALVQFGALTPFLQGSVGGANFGVSQQIIDSITGATVTTSTFDDPSHLDWVTFVFPRTGNPNIDSDTFRQCVVIRLPKGFTAPADVSVTDSNGNVYVGFSRVCVHLWCLWSYVVTDERMECPCHGSQYVPGSGTYPNLKVANDQLPGQAVQGPASLQTAPNNMLPLITLKINADSSFSATGVIGQIGCGQKC
jgi:Rieske Fe-S protein